MEEFNFKRAELEDKEVISDYSDVIQAEAVKEPLSMYFCGPENIR